MPSLDDTDARILLALDETPEATVVALAARLGLARNTVHARLRRMEADGRLGAVSRRAELPALGYPLLAFMTLEVSQRASAAATEALARIPEVVELLSTTGDGDYLARVAARDTDDLQRLTQLVLGVPGVVRSSTAIVLQHTVPLRVGPLLRRAAGGGAPA